MKIFSAARPTGEIHIGNYLGSIKQWIDLKKIMNAIFALLTGML